MDDNNVKNLEKRLDAVIGLLIQSRSANDNKFNLGAQIEFLNNMDFKPKEIADILGKTPGHISKELTGIRKKRKK